MTGCPEWKGRPGREGREIFSLALSGRRFLPSMNNEDSPNSAYREKRRTRAGKSSGNALREKIPFIVLGGMPGMYPASTFRNLAKKPVQRSSAPDGG
jgi:hypothetical protein